MTFSRSRTTPPAGATLSRRRLFELGTVVAAGTTLAGCKVQTKSSSPAPGNKAEEGKVVFPKPAASLPTGDVTYRTIMSGGIKLPYFQAVWNAFHKDHANITMNLDATQWAQINQVVPLGVRNGTCQDMFQMPQTVPVQVAVSQGWVAPLEDIIPDFEQWKAAYPPNAFIPGVHVFNGKTYSWTFTSSRSQYGFMVFYDSELMKKAGYDPSADRFTWDTFRAAAKKITQQGGGKSYGLFVGGADHLGDLALELATLAGMAGGAMNWKTGEYNYTQPLLKQAIELLLSIQSDGSFFPGDLTLTQNEVNSRFPQGKAGMTLDGAWSVVNWKKDAPDFQYGIAMPPTPSDKAFHHTGYDEGTAAPLFIYAKTKYPHISGELLRYMGSVEGQTVMVELTNGLFSSEIAKANDNAKRSSLISGQAKQAADIQDKLRVIQPMPQIRNPAVGQVILEEKAVQPTLDQIVQGIFTGQVKNIDKALQGLQDQSMKNLDQAIAAAQKKGAKVSHDDWVYPNWNPEKDYTAADYAQLAKD